MTLCLHRCITLYWLQLPLNSVIMVFTVCDSRSNFWFETGVRAMNLRFILLFATLCLLSWNRHIAKNANCETCAFSSNHKIVLGCKINVCVSIVSLFQCLILVWGFIKNASFLGISWWMMVFCYHILCNVTLTYLLTYHWSSWHFKGFINLIIAVTKLMTDDIQTILKRSFISLKK